MVLDGDDDDSTMVVTQPTPQSEAPTNTGSFSSSRCSQPGPSHLSGETSQHSQEVQKLDTLLSFFSSRFTAKQIQIQYRYSGGNFDNAIV